MFRVMIRKTLKGAQWHYLQRQFYLPFPPYVGLVLCDGDWEARLVKVAYFTTKCYFSCEVDSYVEPKDGVDIIEAVLKHHIEIGWEKMP